MFTGADILCSVYVGATMIVYIPYNAKTFMAEINQYQVCYVCYRENQGVMEYCDICMMRVCYSSSCFTRDEFDGNKFRCERCREGQL